ncbi:Putative auxin efflux carrier component 5 [Gossypium arboreum]|uniref:Putative auxin efflux carrier component 5 n=1 Tax=Gossypium arboreum TaxID=29729 RepID=A0A0B0N240_GOSAR|nr:Putative auxin efflux carrier component 5 [Gossypium arboreum]
MILAYVSVKWWKLFTPEQCAGINKFVAKFSIPLLSFQVISENNPYKMNLKLILADFLQKLLAFLVLFALTKLSSRGGLSSIITGLSLSTMPNTLILGIPLLRAMYGDKSATLLAQIVVLQSLIWYNLLLFLFELNATKAASEITVAVSQASGPRRSTRERGRRRDTNESKEIQDNADFLDSGEEANGESQYPCYLTWWNIKFPAIVEKSIAILSSGGLGMAMFSLGLFMASRPSIIACGIRMAAVAMIMKFIAGPALMAAASTTLGLKGKLLRVAIVQAALPQGIVPFVFAKEYNVHPDILSTGVIFGMLIALPVALVYYLLLAL